MLLGASLRSGAQLLDVGTGSGWIAQYFANHPDHKLRVWAVDAKDERIIREGVSFHLIEGTELPFPDQSFDVVVSNHVIEHVGDNAAQLRHLQEARRVLKPGGVVYLAVPNRWSLVEPHFRLPFLSWLPSALASRYVRLANRGAWYDCRPLGPLACRNLFRAAAFDWRDSAARAFVALLKLEYPSAVLAAWLASVVEYAFASVFGFLSPTQIFILEPRRPDSKASVS